jgi:hypothetical protein
MAEYASSPINDLGPLASKFRPIEEAWFDKTKKDKMFSNWKRRYFSLDMTNKILSYYVDDQKTTFKGILELTSVSILTMLYNLYCHVYYLLTDCF